MIGNKDAINNQISTGSRRLNAGIKPKESGGMLKVYMTIFFFINTNF
jgi:hypothetical protein